MAADDHKALVLRLVEAANRQDADAWAAVYSADATNHRRPAGREGLRRIFESLLTAFPDWRFDVEELIVEGDDVVALMTMTGTHRGTPALPVLGGGLTGVPPTGKCVAVQTIHRIRIANGEIVDHRAVRDDLAMMQQLGLLPAPEHAAGDLSRPPR